MRCISFKKLMGRTRILVRARCRLKSTSTETGRDWMRSIPQSISSKNLKKKKERNDTVVLFKFYNAHAAAANNNNVNIKTS